MAAIFLSEADVEQLIDMPTALDAVEEAFRRLATGEAINVPRQRAVSRGLVLHTMSAAAPYLGFAGWKTYTTTKQGARFHLGLYDHATGTLVAMIEADYLGRLRTGAATGVAAEWLAPSHATEVGIFGGGRQASTQLVALAQVRPLKHAYVYCRDEQRRDDFADSMSAQLGFEVVPVDRPQEAVADLPIVVTATTSQEPVFDGGDLAEGALVCAVGSNWLSRAEIDATTVRRADNIVCDSVEACRLEAGDFVDAAEKGSFNWQRVVGLADVVTGRATGRNSSDSVVLFKSVGLAIEDIALAAVLFERAKARGMGRELPF
jgi:ornithine cyclodeaminase/alanine dehydrogenase-like protein (mu-crystallin family)